MDTIEQTAQELETQRAIEEDKRREKILTDAIEQASKEKSEIARVIQTGNRRERILTYILAFLFSLVSMMLGYILWGLMSTLTLHMESMAKDMHTMKAGVDTMAKNMKYMEGMNKNLSEMSKSVQNMDVSTEKMQEDMNDMNKMNPARLFK